MPQIKGTILAQDIKTSTYCNSEDCAITRALLRAGYNMRDAGTTIDDEKGEIVVSLVENSKKFNLEYQKLGDKVVNMYNGDLQPEDFDFEINY